MIFLYRYQGKDGLGEGRLSAPSEAEAYSLLRKSGIHPMKVWPAPGLLNRLSAIGKRGLAIIVLATLCLVLAVFAFRISRSSLLASRSSLLTSHFSLLTSSSPRHQIYGDPALLAELRSSDYAAVFSDPGDRILARFAQPGHPVSVPITNHLSLVADVSFATLPDDPREVRELKAIVRGMKDELRDYLANGVGTTETYLRRLNERQEEETAIYERERSALRNVEDPEEYERVNAALRRIGLRTIPIPKFSEIQEL